MSVNKARPAVGILCVAAFALSGCAQLTKAQDYVKSLGKKPANPSDACTFLDGGDISQITGDQVLSKQQIPRESSSADSTQPPQYDCSYNLSSTSSGFAQSNMEVHVIPYDSYDTLIDSSSYSQTSTETDNSGNGSVAGFSSGHTPALWNQSENTLVERGNGYAISIHIPFTHGSYNVMDSEKDLAKHIFSNLPSK